MGPVRQNPIQGTVRKKKKEEDTSPRFGLEGHYHES